jgi:tetratricopeptide (TPR) repeat protein
MRSCRPLSHRSLHRPLPLLALLAILLASLLAPAPTVAESPSVSTSAAPVDAAEVAYRFALAKSLAAEGSIPEAVSELAEVVRMVPDDPYVRLAYAALLSDLANGAPSSQRAGEHRAEAGRQAEVALTLDPDNLEAWRAVAQARLSLAQDDRRQLEAALAALERVHREDPADYRTAMILAQIHLETGQADRAVEVLERLAAEVPSHPQVTGMLVNAYLTAGRKPEAEELLDELLAVDPSRDDLRLDLARLQSERGDHRSALATLRAVPTAEQESEPTLIRREALELYFLDRFDESLARLGATPDGPAAEATNDGLRALNYAAQGRHVEFAEVLGDLDLDLAVHSELARLLEQRGAVPQAEEVFSTLLARLEAGGEAVGFAAERLTVPATVVVRDELASLQARAGRPAAAAATLEPLLEGGESEVRSAARLRSAALLHQAGETEGALALLAGAENSLEADLVRLDVLFSEGEERAAARLLRRLGRSEEAQTVLRAAAVAQGHERYDLALPLLEELVEREPLPRALFQLGAAYERSGEVDQAVGTFRRLLAAHPDFDEASNYLGYLWADRGENLEEALGLIRRAVAAEPDNAAYVDSLGWVHYRLGDYQVAVRYLERAARLLPDDPEILEHLGDVYRDLGDERRARELYLRALDVVEDDGVELRRKVDELAVD